MARCGGPWGHRDHRRRVALFMLFAALVACVGADGVLHLREGAFGVRPPVAMALQECFGWPADADTNRTRRTWAGLIACAALWSS